MSQLVDLCVSLFIFSPLSSCFTISPQIIVTYTNFVNCDNLVKIYKIADLEVVALQGLELTVSKGDILALVGPSGAGKSTLLNVIGGLDSPSAGKVQVANYDLLAMKSKQRVTYKREIVGFVWQQSGRWEVMGDEMFRIAPGERREHRLVSDAR